MFIHRLARQLKLLDQVIKNRGGKLLFVLEAPECFINGCVDDTQLIRFKKHSNSTRSYYNVVDVVKKARYYDRDYVTLYIYDNDDIIELVSDRRGICLYIIHTDVRNESIYDEH